VTNVEVVTSVELVVKSTGNMVSGIVAVQVY